MSNIEYFILLKELPNTPIGTQLTISEIRGVKVISTYGIEIEYDLALKTPDWFKPITLEEHKSLFKNNVLTTLIEKGITPPKAEKLFLNMFDTTDDSVENSNS